MPRLRTMVYVIAAGIILACSLLASNVVASPQSPGCGPWGEGDGCTIPKVALVHLCVCLQRPNSPPPSAPWAVPVTLTFSQPGGPVLFSFDRTLDESGQWEGSLAIPYGTYDVRLRNMHTLTNVWNSVAIGPTNDFCMGTLLEGDANADNKVRSSDFTILRAAYFTNEGDACQPPAACWDPRADFDEDNRIRASDFALLAFNYFKTGDIPVTAEASAPVEGAGAAALMAAEPAGAPAVDIVAIRPESKSVKPGDPFTLDVMIEGSSPVVSADVQILFDPNFLEGVSVVGGGWLNSYFIDKSDLANGKIWVGEGDLAGAMAPPFKFATLTFKAKSNLGMTHLAYNLDETYVEGMYGTVLDKSRVVEGDVRIGPHARIKPGTAEVHHCDTAGAELSINDVVNANSADVMLRFDPAKLMVVDQDPAAAGVQIAPLSGFMKPDSITANIGCNSLEPANPACDQVGEVGTIHYAFTQTGSHAPVSGSGAIAQIAFRPVGDGASDIDIVSSVVRDGTGAAIEHFGMNGSLATVALGTPAVGIQRMSSTTARLNWPAPVSGASGYRVYASGTAPYFSPAEPAHGAAAGSEYDDGSALGSPDTHSFYVVKAACSDAFTPRGYSNRTGAWNYNLVKGN